MRFTNEVNLKMSELVGTYYWEGFYDVYSDIVLCKDSTFIYHWRQGLAGGTTTGRWFIDRNLLILNSDIQPVDEKETYFLSPCVNIDHEDILITIKDNSNDPLPGAGIKIILKDSVLYLNANNDGYIYINEEVLEQIEISYFGYNDIVFKIKDNIKNCYTFVMIPKDEYYQYFTNEKWIVKNNRLYNNKIKLNQYVKKDYYEKEDNNSP